MARTTRGDGLEAIRADFHAIQAVAQELEDLEVAYSLQVQEALNASLRTANVQPRGRARRNNNRPDVRDVIGGFVDETWESQLSAARLQARENLDSFRRHSDAEVARRAFVEDNKRAKQLDHDAKFARYIDEVDEYEWADTGNYLEDPYDEEEEEEEGGVYAPVRLRFNGYCRAGHKGRGPAGCGAILLQQDNSVVWEGGKAAGRCTAMVASYQALLYGLEVAHSLGLMNVAVEGCPPEVLYHLQQTRTETIPRDLRPHVTQCLEAVDWFASVQFSRNPLQPTPKALKEIPKKLSRGYANDQRAAERQAQQPRSANRTYFCGVDFGEDVGGPSSSVGDLDRFTLDDLLYVLPTFPEASCSNAQGPSTSAGQDDSEGEECVICLDKKDVNLMFSIEICGHSFCEECLGQHIVHAMSNRKLPIKCPQPACDKHISMDECIYLVPSEKDLSTLIALESELSIPEEMRYYCPNPRCSALLVVSEAVPDLPLPCPACSELICLWCKVMWHENMSCEQYHVLPDELKAPEDRGLHSLARQEQWRQCSKCRRMIELTLGCNHMTCICGHEFCYKCGADWGFNVDEAGEFAGPKCGCQLFDDVAEPRRARRRHEARDAHAPVPWRRRRVCRYWRQGNCRYGDRCRFAHPQE